MSESATPIDPAGSREPATPWAKAVAFSKLHVPGEPVVLPNAWDPVSARVIESAGARAVATSSAAMSWAHGRRDGSGLSRYEAIQAIARVVAATELPVSADIETGYASDELDLAVTIRGVLDTGAIGINLEDSGTGDPGAPLWPVAEAARRVQVARAVAAERGVPIYVNARVDTFIAEAGDPADRLEETLRRAAAYLGAGASGIFVPHVADLTVIERLAAEVDGPLNILVGPGSPTVAELAAAGVARVSTGSSLAASALGFLRRATAELLGAGTYEDLEEKISYSDLNALFPAEAPAPAHFRR